MALSRKTRYPSRRTYVVKVRSDAKPDVLAGRLENLVTGKHQEFASGEELLQSIAGDVQANGEEHSSREK